MNFIDSYKKLEKLCMNRDVRKQTCVTVMIYNG